MEKLSRDDAERILQGSGSHEALSSFLDDVRTAFTSPPSAEVRAKHLAAMAAVTPAPAVPRRRAHIGRAGIVGAAVGVVFAATSALAATGNLPSAAQNVVSNAAGHVGVHVKPAKHHGKPDDNGEPKNPKAAENKARADAFTEAKKDWTTCVATKAREHTGPGPFDPEAPPPDGCGPKPRPHDETGNPAKQKDEEHGKPAEPSEHHGDDDAQQSTVTKPSPDASGVGHGNDGRGNDNSGDGVSGSGNGRSGKD